MLVLTLATGMEPIETIGHHGVKISLEDSRVRLEETADVADWLAVAVGVQIPGVLLLVKILAAGPEPIETIGYRLEW